MNPYVINRLLNSSSSRFITKLFEVNTGGHASATLGMTVTLFGIPKQLLHRDSDLFYKPYLLSRYISEAMLAAPSSSSRRFTLSNVSAAVWWMSK